MAEQRETHPTAPDLYVAELAKRLITDGCETNWAEWEGRRVLIGQRSDKKAQWFGTRVHMFTVAAAVPSVDVASLSDFTGWAMQYAKQHKGKGLRSATGT